MQKILPILKERLVNQTSVSFDVIDPDIDDYHSGEKVNIDNDRYIYRGYKAWTDLAELLMCKMLTPRESSYPLVTLTFKKLEIHNSFHLDSSTDKIEKYGIDSQFSKVNKMEEPAFLHYYLQALHNVKIQNKKRILNLGINRADEFKVIRNHLSEHNYNNISFVGIDHSQSAITFAQNQFPEDNVSFFTHDINDIDTLGLGRFDLLISIGTLQSPGINFKPFFMSLVQYYLEKDAAIILGFPNSRWVGGEMIYGAKAPNYSMSEQSLLYNDVMFCKKYLQQKKFRVTITGKQYVFLTATKIGL
jgi:hypothetical protein